MPGLPTDKKKYFFRMILFILLVALAMTGYWLISRLHSAKLTITALTVSEKKDRTGTPIPGSKLVALKLSNNVSGAINFCLDPAGQESASSWSIRTEIFYPALSKWIELRNGDIWSGSKITPGALEIKIEKRDTLELEFYAKGPRGWRFDQPRSGIDSSLTQELIPQKLRVSTVAISGQIIDTKEISL